MRISEGGGPGVDSLRIISGRISGGGEAKGSVGDGGLGGGWGGGATGGGMMLQVRKNGHFENCALRRGHTRPD